MNRNKLLDQAQRAIERQQYDRAVRAYRALLSEDPHNLKLALKLAELYLRVKDHTSALRLYHHIARRYQTENNQFKSSSVYQLIIKISPRDLKARLPLFQTAIADGDQVTALSHLGVLSQLYAGEQRDLLLKLLRTFIQRFPDEFSSRQRLADIALEMELNDEAIEHLKYLFAHLLDPSQEDQRIRIGERLIELDPELRPVRIQLCELHLRQGNAQVAMRSLQELFRSYPSDLDILLMLGRALYQLNQQEKALKALKSVALASRTRGELDRAVSAARLLTLIDPHHPLGVETLELHGSMSPALEAQGNSDTASEQAQRRDDHENVSKPEMGEYQTRTISKDGMERHAHLLAQARERLAAHKPEEAFELIRQVLEVESTHRGGLELLIEVAQALDHHELLSSAQEALRALDATLSQESYISQQDTETFDFGDRQEEDSESLEGLSEEHQATEGHIPVFLAPHQAESADEESADAEPADAEPADAESADAEPADAESADAESADAESADIESEETEVFECEPEYVALNESKFEASEPSEVELERTEAEDERGKLESDPELEPEKSPSEEVESEISYSGAATLNHELKVTQAMSLGLHDTELMSDGSKTGHTAIGTKRERSATSESEFEVNIELDLEASKDSTVLSEHTSRSREITSTGLEYFVHRSSTDSEESTLSEDLTDVVRERDPELDFNSEIDLELESTSEQNLDTHLEYSLDVEVEQQVERSNHEQIDHFDTNRPDLAMDFDLSLESQERASPQITIVEGEFEVIPEFDTFDDGDSMLFIEEELSRDEDAHPQQSQVHSKSQAQAQLEQIFKKPRLAAETSSTGEPKSLSSQSGVHELIIPKLITAQQQGTSDPSLQDRMDLIHHQRSQMGLLNLPPLPEVSQEVKPSARERAIAQVQPVNENALDDHPLSALFTPAPLDHKLMLRPADHVTEQNHPQSHTQNHDHGPTSLFKELSHPRISLGDLFHTPSAQTPALPSKNQAEPLHTQSDPPPKTSSKSVFTPLPLSISARSDRPFFAKPCADLEIDRAKHHFRQLTREEPLPSPFNKRQFLTEDRGEPQTANAELHVDDDMLASPHASAGKLSHLSQEEVDLLTLETVDLLDGVDLDHDLIIEAMHQDQEAPEPLSSQGLSNDLWEDEVELNEIFEEAFFALQTPEPLSISQKTTDWRDQAATQRLSDFSGRALDPSQIEVDSLLVPQPECCFILDPHRDQPISLIELSQMLIQSGQPHSASDQLAPALLSPKPLGSLRYLQALAWIKGGSIELGVFQLTQLLSEAEETHESQPIKELLIKLIMSVTVHTQSSLDTPDNGHRSSDQRETWLTRLGAIDEMMERRIRRLVIWYIETLQTRSAAIDK